MSYNRLLLATSTVCAPLVYYNFFRKTPSEADSFNHHKLETSLFTAVGNLMSPSAVPTFSNYFPICSVNEPGYFNSAMLASSLKSVPLIYEGNFDSSTKLCGFDPFRQEPVRSRITSFSYDEFNAKIDALDDRNNVKLLVNYFFKPLVSDIEAVFGVPSLNEWKQRHRAALEAEEWFRIHSSDTLAKQAKKASMRVDTYDFLKLIANDQVPPGDLKVGMMREICVWRIHEQSTLHVIQSMKRFEKSFIV